MGFYGNITNTSRTQFQFDKVYSNRYDMERSIGFDGIYAGRYVLVEYDQEFQHDNSYRVYIINNEVYKSNQENEEQRVKPGDFSDGAIVYTSDSKQDSSTGYYSTNIVYYELTNGAKKVSLTKLIGTEDNPNYTVNYNIDIKKYGAGRGYDSTVWQKTYMSGTEKYIMIAELNSVVPTFDVSADAPTMNPLVPHFDTKSTDIYYKLHWQPSWGFRIAEAAPEKEGTVLLTTSADTNVGKYPSDIKVVNDKNAYDSSTGINKTEQIEYNGAIYFNEAGLDETTHNAYNNESFKDEISVRPSGISGNVYNKHDGSGDTEVAPDIQELCIILPSIGNILCKVWDTLYGYNEKTNIRYRDTEWKEAENPEENMELGGMTRDLSTIAGCINSVHDLMGMIYSWKTANLTESGYQKHYIYVDADNTYKRIRKYPVYKVIDTTSLVKPEKGNLSDQEYNDKCKEALKTFIESSGYKNEDWYLIKDKKNREATRISKNSLFNLNGQKIGYQSGYGYELVEMEGFADNLSTINGLILDLKNLVETEDKETRNKETIRGLMNSLNDIIALFDELNPGEFVITNGNGNAVSANWTTKQTYDYTNYGGVPSNKADFSTKENQWIEVNVDENEKLVSIFHKNHSIDGTETSSDKNDIGKGTGLNNSDKDKLFLYTPIVDSCGHIVGENTETVILPYDFKTVHPAAQSTAVINPEANTNDIIADNTQDTLTIASSNKWIRMSGNNTTDTLSIGHEVHSFADSAQSHKYYGLEQNESIASLDVDNTFEVPCFSFDEAGHITGARTHTVALPENFTDVSITTKDDATTDKTSGSAGTIKADTLTDTLTLAEGNRWINIEADPTNDKVSFSHYVKKFTPTTSTTDYNSATSKAFTVQELSYDNAGHITAVKSHSHTLPDSIKTIAIANSGNASKAVDGAANNGNLTAKTLVDTATIDTGNRWIVLSANTNDKKVIMYHAAPGATASTTKTGDETPNFGATFSIPEVKYDEAGHVSGTTTHTVLMPKPSLNNISATDANVLTGISLVPSTGAFTQTNANVGTLKLTGYAVATAKKDIAATDTINSAFGQAQYRITSLENNLATEVSERKDAITQEVSNRNTAITNAINALDVEKVDNEASKTIKSWTEVDGKVSIETQDIKITNANIAADANISMSKISGLVDALNNKQDTIPDETYDTFGAAAAILGTTEDEETAKTIYGLLKKIETLQTSLTALEARVAALEPTIPDSGTEETE